MSAFNASFIDSSSVEFFTLTEVTLPGPIPRGMTYESELRSAIYKGLQCNASDDEIDWYRRTVSPDIDIDDREHTINIYIHTLRVFKPSHHLFRWILKLTDILNDHVTKYSFAVRIGAKYYNSVYKHDQGSTMNHIIRHTIDSMYAYNILTTFCMMTTWDNHRLKRPCYHHGSPPDTYGPNNCFRCYLNENDTPYGVYLFDGLCISYNDGFSSARVRGVECVIYDINSDVIDWFVNVERFHRLKLIHFERLMDVSSYGSNKPCLPTCYHHLFNPHAYLTPERLSLLIRLMKEDSHLLDRIYGTSSCTMVSEIIIDIPPNDKSSIETQTESPKGLISRILGL